ncbi:MAG TPA: DoxX subfamily [Acidobacteriota bacterium]|jgi:thiosulfate dehydrogenase [quinone] large subunit|nr:DoxX subfamily [Acidobacteriota bacterium]
MATSGATSLSGFQQVSLILLRTLIGWHFLYEGYYKLGLPSWSRAGQPLTGWTASGYLRGATGLFSGLFHRLADPRWAPFVDRAVEIVLLLIGLSLILGCLTQIGSWGALLFLTLVYLAAIPAQGIPQQGNEGTYLFVNKTLIEWAAVLILIPFRTGEIAGLDLLRRRAPASVEAN